MIKQCAFLTSEIECIKIPSDVTTIEDQAFQQCEKLHTIEFSENSELNNIGSMTFLLTSVTNISFPSNIEEISFMTFCSCCNLKKIEFPNNYMLHSIGPFAFSASMTHIYGNLIEEIKIPPHVLKIKSHAFYGCRKLHKIEFSKDSELCSI